MLIGIETFIPTAFNSLPTIEAATRMMNADGKLELVLHELEPIFTIHEMEDFWGICLLHKHWEVFPDELPMQQPVVGDEGIEYVSMPRSARSSDGYYPSVLSAIGKQPGRLRALEYSTDEVVAEAYGKLVANPDFAREVGQALVSLGLETTFGLTVCKGASDPGLELIETTTEDRVSIVREVKPNSISRTRLLPTAWTFSRYKNGLDCVKSCFQVCCGVHEEATHTPAHQPK